MNKRFLQPAFLLSLGFLTAACSPALNWRTVTLDAPGLELLLPCKPERAERTVEWSPGSEVVLTMSGCEADGTTFAVSYLRLDDPARAPALLEQWQAAMRSPLHRPVQGGAADQPDQPDQPPAQTAFVPRGALPLAQSVRVSLQSGGAGGPPVSTEAAWFARREGGHAWLFHAMAYNTSAAPREAVSTFFAGLRLR